MREFKLKHFDLLVETLAVNKNHHWGVATEGVSLFRKTRIPTKMLMEKAGCQTQFLS